MSKLSIGRESKYRHLTVESHSIHRDVSFASNPTFGETIASSANGEIAFVTSSNKDVRLLSLDPTDPREYPSSFSHSCNVLDLSFRFVKPVNQEEDSLLATGGSDGNARIWSVKKGTEVVSLDSTSKSGVHQVKWHPTSSQLLATSNGSICQVWDVGSSTKALFSTPFSSNAMSLAWDTTGSQLCYSLPSEKQVAVFDPRSAEVATLIPSAHAGTKFSSCEFGLQNFELLSCGQNSNRDREIALWDVRNVKQTLYRSRLDASPNFFRPFVDTENGLVYYFGHGDGNVRVYELSESVLSPINNFALTLPSPSCCLVAKSYCNMKEFEVNRILRFGKEAIQQVSMRVPRKPDSPFEDLFPLTRSTEEALSVDSFVKKQNALPRMVDLHVKPSEEVAVVDAGNSPVPSEPSPPSPGNASKAENDRRFSKFLGYQAKLKYTKIVQSNKEQSVFGLSPGDLAGDANLLACSSRFYALPWKSLAGGPLFVSGTKQFGGKLKTANEPVLVQGHADKLSCLQFSEFDDALLATGSEDATLRVYQCLDGIESDVKLAKTMVDRSLRLTGHRLAVRGLSFHRVASNVLTSFSADETIRLWDLEAGGKEVCVVDTLPAAGNVDWNYAGNTLAVACRDSSVRFLDPRNPNRAMASIAQSHEGLKASRVCWLDENVVLTTGFGRTGDRQFRLWDKRNVDKMMSSTLLDPGSGVMMPYVVEDNGAVVMCAKGELSIRVFEVEGLISKSNSHEERKYTMHKCNEFRATGEAMMGISFLPRRMVDYQNAEWLSGMRLTPTSVEKLSFQVPRSKEIQGYFYDDLYPPARSSQPALTSSEWFNGKEVAGPLLEDLNKLKLKILSERPVSESHQAIKRGEASVERMRMELEAKEKKERESKEAMDRMQRLAVQHEAYNPNLSQSGAGHVSAKHAVDVAPSDVKEDEWDD